ncbi:pyridoxamine 5'-phosphate oxidase family protein [Streptomyces yaanensis]|uniref:Pyridoxamine 5'-phosphate oxidase family protein n=1 Tax=Streptomyces yaanensis TaxID=1142239 RepID=A0ABV7SMB4_9ACTN|nr:pyridoxamine 5'-phosphate oxidase family protein [Streptomyces sp. CGMCC 4.7035]WNC00401.1 pyridoxamine 5'-phosphate oxidase family protein [Streptomyces sp. CGMCC 4.7035]
MAVKEPTLEEVEKSVCELLQNEPVCTLATLAADGYPSTAAMHFAPDGLIIYMHTFVYTRKLAHIRRDPRVSYSVHYDPPGGYDERTESRSIQVQGRGYVVTDPEEIARAVDVSMRKSRHEAQDTLLNNVKPPEAQGQQVLLRVEAVQALWADFRVRLLWRQMLEFGSDGRSLTGMQPYDTVIGRRTK